LERKRARRGTAEPFLCQAKGLETGRLSWSTGVEGIYEDLYQSNLSLIHLVAAEMPPGLHMLEAFHQDVVIPGAATVCPQLPQPLAERGVEGDFFHGYVIRTKFGLTRFTVSLNLTRLSS
jgi:hypothetical protein